MKIGNVLQCPWLYPKVVIAVWSFSCTETRGLRYQALGKACSELERIGRLLRAWEWTEAKEKITKKEREIARKNQEIERATGEKESHLQEVEVCEAQYEEVKTKREKELQKGGKLKKKEEDVAELEKALVKMKTQADIKKNTIEEEEEKVANLKEESKQVHSTSYLITWKRY